MRYRISLLTIAALASLNNSKVVTEAINSFKDSLIGPKVIDKDSSNNSLLLIPILSTLYII